MVDEHPAVRVLREMLPDAGVFGGSFAAALPSYHATPADSRRATLMRARSAFLDDLFHAAGIPTTLLRDGHGAPVWPNGWVGSITHKGAVVLVATSASGDYRSIGIDLERDDGNLGELLPRLSPEGSPPAEKDSYAALLAFTAKEAAYKAIYHLDGRRLSFEQLDLEWVETPLGHRCTTSTQPGLEIHVRPAAEWLVAAAYIKSVRNPNMVDISP